MVDANPATLIITLRISHLYVSVKTEIVSMGQKQDPTTCCLWETHFKYKDTYRWKVNGWRKIYHANSNEKKAGVAINFRQNRLQSKESYQR